MADRIEEVFRKHASWPVAGAVLMDEEQFRAAVDEIQEGERKRIAPIIWERWIGRPAEYAEFYAWLADQRDSQPTEKCPTCKSNERDWRNVGEHTPFGWMTDGDRGTEVCDDSWHEADTQRERKMKGTDVTPSQIKAAAKFVNDRRRGEESPSDDRIVSLRFGDLARLVAWYGAMRYIAGRDGINSLENPGDTFVRDTQRESGK